MAITVSTGMKEFPITNDKGEVVAVVVFNPTDPAFAERLYMAFAVLDDQDQRYHEKMAELGGKEDPAKLFDIAREMDKEMRQKIDEALGTEVCRPAFGNVSVYAWSNGLPIWANLLLNIMDEMDSAIVSERKAADPRIKKYTAKFGKKAG